VALVNSVGLCDVCFTLSRLVKGRDMQTEILIATRHYCDWDPKTGEEFQLQDRLLRMGARSFVLMVAGDWPGDPEVAKPIGLAGVFEWLQECTWQIKRAVIVNE